MNRPIAASLLFLSFLGQACLAEDLKAGAAATRLAADDSHGDRRRHRAGQGQGPGGGAAGRGRRGRGARRAARSRLVACDVLMVERDVLDRAARRIERDDRHPVRPHPDQRHAHPPRPDDRHDPRLRARGGVHPPGRRQDRRGGRRGARRLAPATLQFRLGEESSVGQNSRLLLGDGTIYWVGLARRRRPADRPVRPRAAGLAFRAPGRRARGRAVQPLDPHDRHAQAGRPLAVVLRPGRAGAGEGDGAGRSSSSRGRRARRTTST